MMSPIVVQFVYVVVYMIVVVCAAAISIWLLSVQCLVFCSKASINRALIQLSIYWYYNDIIIIQLVHICI